ncbi:MAG TPA: HAMP domain-containing sensor histidine kinase [Phenylobacterium sp.]|jgi:signal transduction histidine kinase|uniref:sensor histidine kinase n=1 Tax=Phenylobacterium sp. TaxID=1871053 RepID=UPI002C82FC92|nr:HAMP domain-containing sensor histidine kinase [Phenylobacterium sp.]HXA40533.1 HAMP domain-containing sensor histidine kinase [Phenylobacterium sp.]
MRAGSLRPSLRLRPLAFTAFAMTTVLGAVALAFYLVNLSAEDVFLDRERDAAVAEGQILAEAFAVEGAPGLVKRMERRTRLAAPESHYALFDPAGRRIGGDLLAAPTPLPLGDWVKVSSRTRAGPITLNATAARLPDGSLLVVGRDAAGQRDFEARTADGLLIALAIVVTASLGVGLLLNALVIRRAEAVAGVAERIAAGDLGARAEVSERGDSFDRIGASLNRMLDRIEELLTGMRTVTDSLAHDLRTPLTRMRGAVEGALDPATSHDDCRAALDQVSQELERVLSVFAALIDIARAESGLSREMMQPLRLDELALDLASLFAPVLEDAGQTLEVRPMDPLAIDGHEQLLRQAVGNLLFNAARHAGSGATVTLEVLGGRQAAEIVVADDGPGIPDADRERVKDRFVRLDEARGGAGSGLGLSIVAAAAKLHGGELRLEDNRPGLRAVLTLGRGDAGPAPGPARSADAR